MQNENSTNALSAEDKQSLGFLKMLGKQDYHFRTFDDMTLPDGTKRQDQSLGRKFSQQTRATFNEMRKLNAMNAGAFVVINDGGQTDAEIVRVVAVFADTDGAPLEPLMCLQPHIVVESSPGKWHVYWLVDEFPLAMFKPVQQAIAAKYGTDKSICNLSRVMRLPGFNHCKGEQYPVRILQLKRKLPRYSLEKIVAGLSLSIGQTESSAADHFQLRPLPSRTLDDTAAILSFINPDCSYDDWLRVCFAIADEYGEAGRDLFVRWSAGEVAQR